MMPRTLSRLIAALAVAAIAVVTAEAVPAAAAWTEDLHGQSVMADEVMDDWTSMTVDQVQAYLNAKNRECDPALEMCLWQETTGVYPHAAEKGYCPRVPLKGSASWATIIVRISVACEINPRVLLAALEYATGAVTGGPRLEDFPFTAKMCPMNTEDCGPVLSGANSLYFLARGLAHARYLHRQATAPATSAGGILTVGGPVSLTVANNLYVPSCGSTTSTIYGSATASLYAVYGDWATSSENDPCSSGITRGFWRTYTDMFGPTTPEPSYARAVPQRDWTGDRNPDYFAAASTGILYGYFQIPGTNNIGRLKYGRGWTRMLFATTSYGLVMGHEIDLVAVTPAGDLNAYAIAPNGAAKGPFTIATGFDKYDAVFGGTGWNHRKAGVIFARDGGTGELLAFPANGDGTLNAPVSLGTGWDQFDMLTFAGDMDGDGWEDLIGRGKADGNLYLFPAGATRDYDGEMVQIGRGWGGMRTLIGAGDWNADGWFDFLGITSGGQLYRYLGNGGGGVMASMQVGKGWATFTPFP